MFSYILRNRAVALFFTFVLICISFLLQMAYKKQKKKKVSQKEETFYDSVLYIPSINSLRNDHRVELSLLSVKLLNFGSFTAMKLLH